MASIPIPPNADRLEARAGIQSLLKLIGEDPDRDGLKNTPARFVRAFEEMTSGYRDDPAEHLSTTFDEKHDEVIALAGISFVSLCEHHLLPFTGIAGVAYIPNGSKVVGLSKLARVVDVFAKRLQNQERLTDQIAGAIQKHLDPRAVAVLIEAEHSCMGCRGVHKPGAVMRTSSMGGAFRDDPAARAEVMSLLRFRRP